VNQKFRSCRSSGVQKLQKYAYGTLREQEFRSCRSSGVAGVAGVAEVCLRHATRTEVQEKNRRYISSNIL
jgi:hypothetical protein